MGLFYDYNSKFDNNPRMVKRRIVQAIRFTPSAAFSVFGKRMGKRPSIIMNQHNPTPTLKW
ncbi:MAG: hypothetical protein ACK5UY_00335 [Holosporales bacterium]